MSPPCESSGPETSYRSMEDDSGDPKMNYRTMVGSWLFWTPRDPGPVIGPRGYAAPRPWDAA